MSTNQFMQNVSEFRQEDSMPSTTFLADKTKINNKVRTFNHNKQILNHKVQMYNQHQMYNKEINNQAIKIRLLKLPQTTQLVKEIKGPGPQFNLYNA